MEVTQTREDTELFKRIKSLVIARLLVGTTLLLGTAIPLEVSGFYSVSRFLFPLVTAILLLTIIYSGMLNVIANLKILAYVQLVGDILLETVVIMATGGIESPFSILYVITIIVASYVIPRRGSFITAIFIGFAFGGLVFCQYHGWTEWWPVPTTWVLLPAPTFAAYIIFINYVGYFLTAILANNLSERLRRMNQMLINKNVQYSYLWTLNRRIVNEIPSGVVTTTKDGGFLSVNPAAKRLLNLSSKEEFQLRLEDAFPDYLVQSILRLAGHEQLIRREIQFQIEHDDEILWLLIEVISLERKSRDPARLMLIMKDVTDQKKFEEVKRKSQRWSTVAEVSAGMAHEIRNPLASISGSIEVLRDQLDLTDSQRRLMNIVLRESDRLNKLISDFLDLARPRTPEFHPVCISSLLFEIMDLLKSNEGYKTSIDFQCDVKPENLEVDIDRDQVSQMIWNLAKNAIEAMPDGGLLLIKGFVCNEPESTQKILENQLSQPFFRLIVTDTGIGMDQDIISRIFDPFTTFKRRGVGIGLAIVYRIVENHKGNISVESKPRKGTSFQVDLPLRQMIDTEISEGQNE